MKEIKSAFRRTLVLVLFPVILLTAVQAQATIVTYSSRAAFDAAVGHTFETWDEFANGTVITDGSTVNGITYNYIPDTLDFRSGVNFMVTNAFAYSSYPNTLGLTGDPDYFTFDGVQFGFSQPISTFAIDISTVATADGVFKATTGLGDTILSYFDPFPGIETGQFIGFTSDTPFSSVSLAFADENSPNNAAWVVDTLRYTPLPPSLLLLGSGLAGLGLLRLRKRFKA